MANAIDQQNVNPLCRKCIRSCRQPANVTLCDCRRFVPYPFKIATAPTEQLGLFKANDDLND